MREREEAGSEKEVEQSETRCNKFVEKQEDEKRKESGRER